MALRWWRGKGLRVLMPALPARLKFGKGRRAEAWIGVMSAVLGPFMPVALAILKGVHLSRVMHPRDGVDVVVAVIGGVCFLGIEALFIGGAMALRSQFRPQRVEILIDRNGVRQPMWGPLDGWRVRLGAIQAVVVIGARPSRNVLSRFRDGVDGMATVKFDAGMRSQSIGWAYSYEVALTAARELARQIERFAELNMAVEVRDEVSVGGVFLNPEEVLARGGVRMELMADGVRVSIGSFIGATPRDLTEKGYLMVPLQGAWGVLMGLGMMCAGAFLPERLNQAAGILAIAVLGMMTVWLLFTFISRVSYEVGTRGVERVTELVWRWKIRRRWKREEIEEIFVWNRPVTSGRVRNVGLVRRGGRRVVLAAGRGDVVDAFVEVLRRELGMPVGR